MQLPCRYTTYTATSKCPCSAALVMSSLTTQHHCWDRSAMSVLSSSQRHATFCSTWVHWRLNTHTSSLRSTHWVGLGVNGCLTVLWWWLSLYMSCLNGCLTVLWWWLSLYMSSLNGCPSIHLWWLSQCSISVTLFQCSILIVVSTYMSYLSGCLTFWS